MSSNKALIEKASIIIILPEHYHTHTFVSKLIIHITWTQLEYNCITHIIIHTQHQKQQYDM